MSLTKEEIIINVKLLWSFQLFSFVAFQHPLIAFRFLFIIVFKDSWAWRIKKRKNEKPRNIKIYSWIRIYSELITIKWFIQKIIIFANKVITNVLFVLFYLLYKVDYNNILLIYIIILKYLLLKNQG